MEKKSTIKKWQLYIVASLLFLLSATSCIKDSYDPLNCPATKPEAKDSPVVTAKLYCNDKLIAWSDDKNIGVFMIDNDKESLLQNSLGAPYILNKKETGLFIPQWGISDQLLSRPPVGIMYDAISIYPYGTSLKDTKSLSLSVLDQSHQEKLDIFIPHRISNITSDTDTLHFNFYRRMSRILFNLKLTEVAADKSEINADEKLAGATILVYGLPVDGTFMLNNEELNTENTQPFAAYMAADGTQGQSIIFPAKSTKDFHFQISLPQFPDTLYSFSLSQDIAFESCNSYLFDLGLQYIHKPAIKQYDIKYRYEGKANNQNVTVTRNNTPIAWGEGDIIHVNENGNFTFQYQSNLKVTVTTENGQTLSMTSGQPHTFNNINENITIIIRTDEEIVPEPEKKYNITYVYEGEANKNNVSLYKNGTTTSWAQTESITVKESDNFTFGYNSNLIVTVKVKDGETLSMTSGNPYTFEKIKKDIEIIISAESPKYNVNYVFQGEHTESNVDVLKESGQNSFEAWASTQTVSVKKGNNFTFKTDSKYTVSVTVKNIDVPRNADGTYSLNNINEDITVVIATNLHKVIYQYIGEATKDNVSVYKTSSFADKDRWTAETEIVLVDHNANFTFGTDSRHEVIASSNGKHLSPSTTESTTKNTFVLSSITTNIIVTIGAKTAEDLLEHKIKYVFITDANSQNTNVTVGNSTWRETGDIKVVKDGDSFTFRATSSYTLNVTVYETNNSNNTSSITLVKSGDNYSISNIKKDLTVYIGATGHNVSFIYTGAHANNNTLPIQKKISGLNTSWMPGEAGKVNVNSNDSFIFANNSPFTITVSGYGNPFDVAPGDEYKINGITKDIALQITAKIHKVTYLLDNAPTDNAGTWMDIELGNQPWTMGDGGVQYIEKGKDFKFSAAPKATLTNVTIEYVKAHVEANQIDMQPTTGNEYELSITDDTEIHIKANKPHKVTYEIKTAVGTTVPQGFSVFHGTNTAWVAGVNGAVTVSANSNFTFGYANNDDYTFTVERKVGPSQTAIIMTVGATQTTYNDENVNDDIHYIITLAKKPVVVVDCPIEITPDVQGQSVDYDGNLEFTPTITDPKYVIKVETKDTNKGDDTYTTVVPDATGKYTINNITKNTTIKLTVNRKPANVPISANIHIWEELPPINGGIIYPKL